MTPIREAIVDAILKEVVPSWDDVDKLLLAKTALYWAMFDDYYFSEWIPVVEQVFQMTWNQIEEIALRVSK
jgi:hypothetical protein